jgi:2-polyprenyl-6-methoxyphenol hydroxylase-like FAD-dependent oxidoreductase
MKTPVLVVGGGPVGLAMAGDLGWRGVACVLIEKTGSLWIKPGSRVCSAPLRFARAALRPGHGRTVRPGYRFAHPG